jgi:predicted permease
VDADIDTELRFHFEMRVQEYVARGMSEADAVAVVTRRLGDIDAARTECRIVDNRQRQREARVEQFDTLVRDVRLAGRTLARQKGWTTVVILTLALGIGANSATFSLVDALFYRTLPVAQPDRLVTIGDPSATGTAAYGSPRADVFSYPVYADVRDQNRVLSGVYAEGSAGSLDMIVQGAAGVAGNVHEHPRGRLVTGNYFDLLGVHPVLGRAFTADEDRTLGGDPVVVLSFGYWQRRFAADRDLIGHTLRINGVVLTVIGVAPRSFTGDIVGSQPDLWIPMMMQPLVTRGASRIDDRKASWLMLMGRLAPGIALSRARAALRGVVQRSLTSTMTPKDAAEFVADLHNNPIQVDPGGHGFSYYRRAYASGLAILLGSVGVLLLVVCANVANLMLARTAARGREISVRLALGASRNRLVRQLLTESAMLAGAAGVLGLLVAEWGGRLLLAAAADGPRPIPLDVRPDVRVLLFTSALTLMSVLLFGLLPAVRATRLELATALRGQARSVAGPLGGGRFRLGRLIVVAQVALSTLLLVGSSLLVRSMQRIAAADLGVPRNHLVLVSVEATTSGYSGARSAALATDLAGRAGRLPGVSSASFSENGIFSGTESAMSIKVPGGTLPADSAFTAYFDVVGPLYFQTIDAQLLRGRVLDAHDNMDARRVIVVNATMARELFPAGDAVGRVVTRHDTALTIVGIIRDVEEQNVRAKPLPRMYLPALQRVDRLGDFNLEIRTSGDPAAAVKPIRDAVLAADRSLFLSVDPLNSLVASSVSENRLVTRVVSFFGAAALVLAALGLYGVIAYTTARRTSEFGLRMALGANPAGVGSIVLREALALTAIGLAIGLPAGVAAARLIRGQLFGIGVVDPASLVAPIAVLVCVTAAASYLPAVRASRVNPVDALRAD